MQDSRTDDADTVVPEGHDLAKDGPVETGIPGETGRFATVPGDPPDDRDAARTDDADLGEASEVHVDDEQPETPETIEPGPPRDEIPGAGSDEKDKDKKDEKRVSRAKAHSHRIRLERADGSRFWHHEDTDDADTAERLARERAMGTIVYVEPLDRNGEPIEGRRERFAIPDDRD